MLFQIAQESASKNVDTPIYEVMQRTAFKALFTLEADKLLDEKI